MTVRLFTLSLFTLVSVIHAGEPPRDAKQTIQQVLDDQATAWNKGDIEGFMKGYWKSEKMSFFSGNAKTAGWRATLMRYKKRYQGDGNEMGKLTFSEVEIELLGPNAAYVRGRFTLVTSKGTPTGLFTLVVRKFPEGWRIVHDHTSG